MACRDGDVGSHGEVNCYHAIVDDQSFRGSSYHYLNWIIADVM